MRKTTRVVGARVLKSGRRFLGSKNSNGEEWRELSDNSGGSGGEDEDEDDDDLIHCKLSGWRPALAVKPEVEEADIGDELLKPISVGSVRDDDTGVDRMWGSVYGRKRKKMDSKGFDFEGGSGEKMALEDKKFGKNFVRRKKKDGAGQQASVTSQVLAAVIQLPSHGYTSWFSCILSLVLGYMRRAKLRLLHLSGFLLSEPLACVFLSHGISFLRDSSYIKSSGICTIFEAKCFIPLFAVDFCAVPGCFVHLHFTLLLRSARLPCVLVTHPDLVHGRMTELVVLHESSPERDYPAVPSVISGNDNHPPVDSVTSGGNDNYPAVDSVTSGNDDSAKRSAVDCRGATRVAGKTVQFRLAAKTRSIRKKSLLRSRRKNTSVSRGRKSSVALVSKFYGRKRDSNLLDPMAPGSGPKSCRKSSKPNIKELKFSLGKDIGSLCCSGNILVIERYKGHRVRGAIVQLEGSASERWSLSIKKDGITQYSLIAGKAMRPCGYNRYTHDIIWTEDASKWKLEFLDRGEWLIFRELYRECYDRNKLVPIVDIVHIPGVYEASDYANAERNSIPFRRPNSYISMKEDELSRALAKQTANYDMDSEDEEWLRKFNDKSLVVNEYWKHVSDQHFEVIIDALEKASYRRPEDFSDEQAAANLCLDLEREEVVEAIYGYWMQKRKKKGTALVKVFQLYQAQDDEVLPRSISRKRSINRQERRGGSRRVRTTIKAGQKASEGQNSSLLEVQEAKAAATPSARSAVKKRRKMMLLSDILASPMVATKPAATAVEGNVNVLEEEDSLIEVQVQFQEAKGAASESVGLVVDECPKKQQFMGTPKTPPKAAKRRRAAAESALSSRTAQVENLEAMGPSKLENMLDEAFAAAGRSAAAARRKRQKAQASLQHADLATYKATMAFRHAQGWFGVADAADDNLSSSSSSSSVVRLGKGAGGAV